MTNIKLNLMKGGTILLFPLFLLVVMAEIVFAGNDDLMINEIFPNPIGSDKNKEFVEIYNRSDRVINLKNLILKKISKKGGVKKYKFPNNRKIRPKKYFSIKINGLNNDQAELQLIKIRIGSNNDDSEAQEIIIDRVKYNQVKEGQSYNRDKNDLQKWYWAKPTKDTGNTDNPIGKKYPQIFINEILPNPTKNESKNEFIELYNPNRKDVNLEGWVLRDGSKNGKYIIPKRTIIKGKKYLTIYRSDFKFALNNTGKERVILLDPNDNYRQGEYKDKMQYENSQEGRSWNRLIRQSEKWYLAKPTPGKPNSENKTNGEYPTLLLSEILPNPAGKEKEKEYIEIYNPNKFKVDLIDWTLADDSIGGQYIFPEKKIIDGRQYLTIYRSDFKFALNNSGGEKVKLIAPNHKIVSQVEYQSAKENISYDYNLRTKEWRWSKFLTPNQLNKFNNLPTFQIKKPKRIYKNVYAKFAIKNLQDKDGDRLKIFWDFGDGHKSYLIKTRHKYQHIGKFMVQVRINDGSEKVIKKFIVEVKKYPHRKIKIIGLMPNPSGKDSGREFILIKNYSKKKINLAGYKIASGGNKKELINHPFYKQIVIKPGKAKKIFNKKACKFNLLNQKGLVQLLYPDGEVADELKYKKDKILPNEQFIRQENKKWIWRQDILPINVENNNINKSTNYTGRADIFVLGEKNEQIIDLTIHQDSQMCHSLQQLKVDNWQYKKQKSIFWKWLQIKK